MFVSGFTFIRNAVKLDYPIIEAIQSVLPLCDEFVVALGNSEDDTRGLIQNIGDPKIRIIDTVWDDHLRIGGQVLAIETNKALDAISKQADWAIYIQGDECLHEQDYDQLRSSMLKWKDDSAVEGLLFDYLHFYGSFDYIANSRNWYRKEIRIVKPGPGVRSYKDAQGFRLDGRKLNVKPAQAKVYHYGWVRHPKYQMAKQLEANKFWHDDAWIEQRFDPSTQFDYSRIDSLAHFKGSHPKVMQPRISSMNWEFSTDPTQKKFGFKNLILHKLEDLTGWRPGEYRNYHLLP